jgi:hypothetical protein
LTAGGVGEQTIGGQFTFVEDGKTVPLKFEGKYVVVPRPNSATISADKMNVVYRGVVNQSLYHLQELLIKMLMHPLQV